MKKTMSYKDAVAELKEILELLESGQSDMDELTLKAKRAKELIKFCKEKLYVTTSEVEKFLED